MLIGLLFPFNFSVYLEFAFRLELFFILFILFYLLILDRTPSSSSGHPVQKVIFAEYNKVFIHSVAECAPILNNESFFNIIDCSSAKTVTCHWRME